MSNKPQELIEFDENNLEHLAELDRLVREGHEWAKVLGPKCEKPKKDLTGH